MICISHATDTLYTIHRESHGASIEVRWGVVVARLTGVSISLFGFSKEYGKMEIIVCVVKY